MRIFYQLAPVSTRDSSDWTQPEANNVVCWHCLHAFQTPPFGIPEDFDEFDRLTVTGNFCSLACCKGYVRCSAAFNSHIRMANIDRMAHDVYGVNTCIPSAPDPRCLKLLGGHLTIEQYRATNHVECKFVEGPFVTQRLIIAASQTEPQNDMIEGDSNQMLLRQTQGLRNSGQGCSVRGLRRPSKPLQTEEVLTTSMVSAQPSEYDEFLQTKEAIPTTTASAERGRRGKKRAQDAGSIASFLN